MLKEALEKSLKFEKEISSFYLNRGQQAESILVRKLFFELAKQEIDHMMFIVEAYTTMEKNETALPAVATAPDIEPEIKAFFERVGEPAQKKNATNVEAVEAAMKLERAGYAMYEKFAAETLTPQEKSFFKGLLVQEAKHLESLDNIHFYLTGTGDWLELDESKRWSWMNL